MVARMARSGIQPHSGCQPVRRAQSTFGLNYRSVERAERQRNRYQFLGVKDSASTRIELRRPAWVHRCAGIDLTDMPAPAETDHAMRLRLGLATPRALECSSRLSAPSAIDKDWQVLGGGTPVARTRYLEGPLSASSASIETSSFSMPSGVGETSFAAVIACATGLTSTPTE